MNWISVKTALPEYDQNVLIIRKRGGKFYEPDIAVYRNGEFTSHVYLPEDCCFNSDWITHWMPLPEPPKE